MNVDELYDLYEDAVDVLGYGKEVDLAVESTPKVAFFNEKTNTITIDPEVLKYYGKSAVSSVLLHEAAHAAERDYAEQNGLKNDPSYVSEYASTKGHTHIFKEFAEKLSNELNGGISVFYGHFPQLDVKMDPRITQLCKKLGVEKDDVVCKIDYFDVSIPSKYCVLIQPKYYTGDELDEDSFNDIADSLAEFADFDFDEAYEIAANIWNR